MSRYASALLAAAALLPACSPKTEQHAEKAAPHWEYEGEAGPAEWAALDPSFATCGSGQSQSPVNLTGSVDIDLPAITFKYVTAGNEIVNNGHTIQVGVQAGSTIEVGGRTFELRQFHFHSPSEHEVEGRSYPLEAHFVHADSSGTLAVVGVLFEEGPANQALARVWDGMPKAEGPAQPLASPVAPESLLPAARDYYHLAGSLTTPPCSEGVNWMVLKTPLTASAEQVAAFVSAIGHQNNRPVQPLNGRVIER